MRLTQSHMNKIMNLCIATLKHLTPSIYSCTVIDPEAINFDDEVLFTIVYRPDACLYNVW